MATNIGFFIPFSTIPYNNGSVTRQVVNIVTAAEVQKLNVSDYYIYQQYQVISDEIPESVSEKLYGKVDYFWTILVVNDMVNPYIDWPMSDRQVELFTQATYGVGNEFAIHHYYWTGEDGKHLANMPLDDLDTRLAMQNALPGYGSAYQSMTNLEYEIGINSAKRQILVVDPQVIDTFAEAYKNVIKGVLT